MGFSYFRARFGYCCVGFGSSRIWPVRFSSGTVRSQYIGLLVVQGSVTVAKDRLFVVQGSVLVVHSSVTVAYDSVLV